MTASYYLLRAVRHGPLVPARLWLCDHGPDDPPDNKLDRGRLSRYPRADIAGTEVEPERITDRAHRPISHWSALQPVTETEYFYQIARLRWAEGSAPADPTLRPRHKVDPASVPMPSFERERA